MVSPEKNHFLDDGDLRRNRIMSNIKDSVLSRLNPDADHSQIHHQLQNLFPSFDTPTHPPYALMIRRAITELNNHHHPIGSTEDAISEFVQREYQDLPWAHVTILNFHLRKLCQSGEVVYTKAGRYILKEEEEEQHPCKGSARKKRTRRRTEESAVEINENGTGGDRVLEVESTQEKGEQQCVVEEKPTQFSVSENQPPQESRIHKDQDEVPPQHYSQGQGNLDENPISGTGCLELEKKLPKRPRGRPRKSDVANYQEESLLDIIHHDEQEELSTNNSKLQDQAKPRGRGRGRGRGRPPKLSNRSSLLYASQS